MGLISAITGATQNVFSAGAESISSVFKDQYQEFFTGDALDRDTLVKRGARKVKNGSNKGDSDVITNGSRIAVPTGTALLLVDNGKVTDFTTEPGLYVWDSSSAPSMLASEGIKEGFKKSMSLILDRFKTAGVVNSEQRVYFVNLLEITGNTFGTPTPIPYRDPEFKSINIRVNGTYTYKIKNPITFFENISGTVGDTFNRNPFTDTQLRTEFLTALSPAINRFGEGGKNIFFSQIPTYQMDIKKELETVLDEDWMQNRGIEIIAVGINPVSPDEKSQARIDEVTRIRNYKDGDLASTYATMGMTDAYKNAGSNASGAVTGFAGVGMLNMAAQGGGMPNPMNAAAASAAPVAAGAAAVAASAGGWTCSCGHSGNTGKFCAECGKPKPSAGWTCSCGATGNTGKFCAECGKPKPSEGWTCSCGATGNTGKFCSECGKPQP